MGLVKEDTDMDRDPKIDPEPGDMLQKVMNTYTVSSVRDGFVTLVFPEWKMSMAYYRYWAAGTVVVLVGERKSNRR